MFYYFITVIYSWFLVGAFTLAVKIAISIQFDTIGGSSMSIIGNALFLFYVIILIFLVIISLAVKVNRIEDLFKGIVTILALYQFYVIYIVV